MVGGTGRVGGSTARFILEFGDEEGIKTDVVLAGRSAEKYSRSRNRILSRQGSGGEGEDWTDRIMFAEVNYEDEVQLKQAVAESDLVIHTAGPFQQKENPLVLDAAIAAGVPYVDVCDEKKLCEAAKFRNGLATARNVPAIVSAGIWPGSSALFASACVDRLREEEGVEAEEVEMSFFTAGTGNAGATIVAATFLLLVEPAMVYLARQATEQTPWSSPRVVDFGKDVGARRVRLLDNPDVFTLAQATNVPNISSRFATAPDIWNWLFVALTWLPPRLLGDATFARLLSEFSDPVIRVADMLVGAVNSMRFDVRGGGKEVTCVISHRDLEECVGVATASFALELLLGNVEAGVQFPPELRAQRAAILERVRRGAFVWEGLDSSQL